MNKRKDREKEEKPEVDQTKKLSPGVFKLRETRDIGEARGFFYSNLDPNGIVLASLLKELNDGKTDILYMGEPALNMIRSAVREPVDKMSIYFDLVENEFTLDERTSQLGSIVLVMDTNELTQLEFNQRPSPSFREDTAAPQPRGGGGGGDDDDGTQPDVDEVPVFNELDSYDLFELVNKMQSYRMSDDDINAAERKFIAQFHESLFDHPADRAPLLYNRLPMWAAIIVKLRELEKMNQTWPAYVFYDCVSHNIFATTDNYEETAKLRLLFATSDLFETFEFRRYSPSHERNYYQFVLDLLTEQSVELKQLRYGNKPLVDELVASYAVLQEKEILTPFALMFYPTTCEFSLLQLDFSIDRTKYAELNAKVQWHKEKYDAILIQQSYFSIYRELFTNQDSVPYDATKPYKTEFDTALTRYRIFGKSGNPKIPSEQSLYRNTSRYSALLNELYNDNLMASACPQTQRAEILFIAFIVYRNFVEDNQRYNESIDNFGLFRTTHDSKSEAAIRYCALINKVDTDDALALDYEHFFEDCLVLANNGNFSDNESLRWQLLFPVHLNYISSFGQWQGALQNVVEDGIVPFGQLSEDGSIVLRNVIDEYRDAALTVWRNTGQYITAMKNQANINTLVSRQVANLNAEFIKQRDAGTLQQDELQMFELTSRKCDMELIDDMLYDKRYTSWPSLTLNNNSLIDYISRITSTPRAGTETEKLGLQIVLLDKVGRSTEYFPEEGGPIATYESVMERNPNSIVLYSAVLPRRRIRKVVLLKQLRPAISSVMMPDEELQRAAEDEDDLRVQEEQKQQEKIRIERGSGSFAKGTHERMASIFAAKHNLYPAQHANTAWREMLILALTVYRKYIEFPKSELEIGDRSQFEKWKQFVSRNMKPTKERNELVRMIEVSRKRLLMLLEAFSENKIKAYDVFLDELLQEGLKNAEKLDIDYTKTYVDNARRYEIGQGKLQKTLEFLYEKIYIPVGPVDDEHLRFTRTLNTYVDQPTATDDSLTEESLLAYKSVIEVKDKEISLFFSRNSFQSEVDAHTELMEAYKEKAPLFLDQRPLERVVNEAVSLIAENVKRSATSVSVHLRSRIEKGERVYSLGAVPDNAPVGYSVTFTDKSVAVYPFADFDKDKIRLLFKM